MNSIIIYYSYGGNTRRIAQMIGQELGADLVEIETVHLYTGSYNDVVNQGQREVNSGFLPEIKPLNVDLSQYDTIVLGSPVWWYTFAPAMNSFLHDTDLSGKTVWPFATNGGWIGQTFKDFSEVISGAKVANGLNVRFNGNKQITPTRDIEEWIRSIN